MMLSLANSTTSQQDIGCNKTSLSGISGFIGDNDNNDNNDTSVNSAPVICRCFICLRLLSQYTGRS